MDGIEVRALDLNINDVDEESKEMKLQGYVATDASSHILGKEGKKKWREVIAPGTFRNAIAKAKRLKESIDLLADHDTKKILASTANGSLKLEEDEVGLYFEATVSPTSYGRDLYVLVKDGIIKGLSFGMKVLNEDWSLAADGMPLRTISEIELFEVSALKTPAYPTTLLEARGMEVADVEIPNDLEFRALIGGNGLNTDNMEVTPKMLYDAISTLAMNQADTNKLLQEIVDKSAFDGLEMAKQVMEQVSQVASAQVPPMDPTAAAAAPAQPTEPTPTVEEKVTEEKVEEPVTEEKAKVEKTEDGTKAVVEDENGEPKAEAKVEEPSEETRVEETEQKAEETPVAETKVEEGKAETAAEPETTTTTTKKPDVQAEVRAWLENNKIMEVPENGN
ncbi:Phage head maturation protease [Enterococcus phage vB_EfaS_140]|uniref:Phage head maturation protease n=1 Tax=Enterococcus phage vB_EfaS_140 TaxID=2730536 RepID=A0ACA9AS89_9CAUD|nr:Phage head maturation protease [Enterococcus phage vB_EfaS_140]